ncbi:MAG: hypothetical protein MK008_12400 [Bdellovibrionales bacterium]|nr:hypothetical protein [Bdellovibrionales bacterium]
MFAAILTFLFYSLISYLILFKGHLHEDAYILYIYAEHLAKGFGISYYQGGPPAEGATDFLWMVLLAGFNKVGINSGIGALILNALGISGSGFILSRLINYNFSFTKKYQSLIKDFLLSVILVISPIACASYAGFSTAFYTFFVILTCFIIIFKKNILWTAPIIGLTLGLIRPDGVILGVGFALVGLFLVYKQRNDLHKYLLSSAISLLLGIIYFYWRSNYFGYLLPLPLYVKSSSNDFLPGLIDNINWIKFNLIIVISALFILIQKYKTNSLEFLIAMPSLTLFTALFFASQSQNISFRFQSPLLITLLFIICLHANKISDLKFYILKQNKAFKYVSLFFITLVVFNQFNKYFKETKFIVRFNLETDYINYFPFHLRDYVSSKNTIALTEAGRFAYWLKGKKVDLVGLNTSDTAIKKPSVDYLEKQNPDLIFIHVANSLKDQGCENANYCSIDINYLENHLNKNLYTNFKEWRNIKNGVYRSPLVVYEFLSAHKNDFELFLVKYRGRYNHLYAFKKNSTISKNDFINALNLSFSEKGKLSYLEMIQM